MAQSWNPLSPVVGKAAYGIGIHVNLIAGKEPCDGTGNSFPKVFHIETSFIRCRGCAADHIYINVGSEVPGAAFHLQNLAVDNGDVLQIILQSGHKANTSC